MTSLASKTRFLRDFCSQPGVSWQACFDQLRPHIPVLWKALDHRQQKYFLGRLKTFWNIHRHRLPPPTESILKEGFRLNKIKIVKNPLEIPQNQEAVINALGTSADPLHQPFLKKLVDSNFILRHPLGLGFQSLNNNIFSLGCARTGQDWEASAAKELALQARDLAQIFKGVTAKAV